MEEAQALIPKDRRDAFAAAVQRFREANAAVAELVEADRDYNATKVAMYQAEGTKGADIAATRFVKACDRRSAALAKFVGA
jgi:hypothetical protein